MPMKLSFTSAVAKVEVGNDASLQSIPKFLDRKFLILLIPVYLDKYDSTAGVNEEKVTRK